MFNLPDRFPVRFAVIAEEQYIYKKFNDVSDYLQFETARKLLFIRYIELLRIRGLGYKSLNPKRIDLKFNIKGQIDFNISELNKTEKWIKKAQQGMKQAYDDLRFKEPEISTAFNVGAYSYKGAYEIPAFVEAYKHRGDQKYLCNNFGYYNSPKNLQRFYKIYKKIQQKNFSDWKLFKFLSEFERPVYISSKYYRAWHTLKENKDFSGIIPTKSKNERRDDFMKALLDCREELFKSKIEIVLCKSWEDLFAEEIAILHKMYNYCHNCGKALPLKHKGKYCPNIKANEDCQKERARKRSKKSYKTKNKKAL